MKKVNLYNYKDLRKDYQQQVFEEFINDRVEFELQELSHELQKGDITEEEYYNALGCSKSYAESTGWFVPSCYYEKHEKDLKEIVEEELENALFTGYGRFVMMSKRD